MAMNRLIVLGLAIALVGCGAPTAPNSAVDHHSRIEVVNLLESGAPPERDEFGSVVLPDEYAHLSHMGLIEVRDDPFMVFFTTWVGGSPDPYCGYEYSPDPAAVVLDPRASGTGEAEPLGGGWYWICAS